MADKLIFYFFFVPADLRRHVKSAYSEVDCRFIFDDDQFETQFKRGRLDPYAVTQLVTDAIMLEYRIPRADCRIDNAVFWCGGGVKRVVDGITALAGNVFHLFDGLFTRVKAKATQTDDILALTLLKFRPKSQLTLANVVDYDLVARDPDAVPPPPKPYVEREWPGAAIRARQPFGRLGGNPRNVMVVGDLSLVGQVRASNRNAEIIAFVTEPSRFAPKTAAMINHRAMIMIDFERIGADLPYADRIVTDQFDVAVWARRCGTPVAYSDAVGKATPKPLIPELRRSATTASAESLDNLYFRFTRYLDPLKNGARLDPKAAADRWFGHFEKPARRPDLSDWGVSPNGRPRNFVLVGRPARLPRQPTHLFRDGFATSMPVDMRRTSLENEPLIQRSADLVIWSDAEDAGEWVENDFRGTRVLSRYQVDTVFGLPAAFYPVLTSAPVRIQDDQRLIYAAADLFDEMPEERRAAYRALGPSTRALLGRLNHNGRLVRLNKFDVARRLGSRTQRWILVLGREEQARVAPNSNPDGLTDLQLVAQTAAEERNAVVLFLPAAGQRGNAALLKQIGGAGPNVRVLAEAFCVNELLELVAEVRTINSPHGICALARGVPIKVYGTPFYARLRLTEDRVLSGEARPSGIRTSVDLDLFLGWLAEEVLYFLDPWTGRGVTFEAFVADYMPALGYVTPRALQVFRQTLEEPESMPAWDKAFAFLRLHAQTETIEAYVASLGLENGPLLANPIVSNLTIALRAANFYAATGRWRMALDIIGAASLKRNAKQPETLKAVIDALVDTRQYIETREEVTEFENRLLVLFRREPSDVIEPIADAFLARNFASCARFLLYTTPRNERTIRKIAQCETALGNFDRADECVRELRARGVAESVLLQVELARYEAANDWTRARELVSRALVLMPDDLTLLLQHADACRETGDYEEAVAGYARLLRTQKSRVAYPRLASLYMARMQPGAARGLLESYLRDVPQDGEAWRILGESFAFEDRRVDACEALLSALYVNPLDVPALTRLLELEKELKQAGEVRAEWWSEQLMRDLRQVRQHSADTLLALGRFGLFENDIEGLVRKCREAIRLFPNDLRVLNWLGHGLAWFSGERTRSELDEVRRHYRAAAYRGPETGWWSLYDYVRVLAHLGDSEEIRRILRDHKKILLGSQRHRTGWPRFVAGAALGDLRLIFNGLRDYPRSALLRRFAKSYRFGYSLDDIRPDDQSIVFLSEGGVGDELRYSTLYPELAARYPNARFTVDSRLHSLYRRWLPHVDFIPVPRYHRTRISTSHMETVDQLPDQALAEFMDNEVWEAMNAADVVVPVLCTAADLRRNLGDFQDNPPVPLKPDPARVNDFARRLGPYEDKLLVGLIWTSMIREYQRVHNYLSLEEMVPILTVPGTAFVNLQYEDASAEIAVIRERYGVEVIDFPDLDKRDDFEGVAALAAALDAVVGVNTATIELTAMVGCPTIFAAPSPQHTYRDPWGNGRDLYFPSMDVVIARRESERPAMIDGIRRMIVERRDAKHRSALKVGT
jgi:tetratricopeptide (TPR) repeat protein